MQQTIFEKALPEPYRIFGVQLLPLSLGRYRLLKRFGCAFVAETEASASVEDLVLGIFICGLKVREFEELLRQPEVFKEELRRWGLRIQAEVRADPHFNLFAKFGLFKAYINQANQVPKYWEEMDSPEGQVSHWSHSIEIALRGQLGWTVEEIEEEPLQKAIADYFQWAQAEGFIRIMSDEEEKMALEQGAENMKALMASLAAVGMETEGMEGLKASLEGGRLKVVPGGES